MHSSLLEWESIIKLERRGLQFLFYSGLTLGSTGLDEQDITVLYRVILALGHDLSGSLDGSFVTVLPQGGVIVDNSLNESLFKVCCMVSMLPCKLSSDGWNIPE